MTLKIALNHDAESRLKSAARRRGIRPEIYAKRIIEENLPSVKKPVKDQATLDLLAQWNEEDETSDANVVASRQKELREFKRAMNRNRLESEGRNSRKVFQRVW